MEKESSEMPSDDGKAILEKNRKRTVKTRAQVQALEKFYDEQKYPTEDMKLQFAESIGLTEKQVSGWFCHRRLKDKKLMNGENYPTGKQDRSSGVIQDRIGGQRQDSCSITKQGNERNFETREVESGRLTPKEFSAAGLTSAMPKENYNHVDDPSSGSSSPLRNIHNHHNVDPLDAATARHVMPKFPADVKGLKTRPGPSGYLKVKGRVENSAITAVKRKLGKHHREDGPPLSIEFDPLPPQAFASAMQEPVEGTYYTGEAVIPASADVTKIHQDPKVGKGYEYNSSLESHSTDGKTFRMRHGSGNPDSYIHQNSIVRTSSNGGVCYPRSNSSVQFPDAPDGHILGSHGGDEYGTKCRPGVEIPRIDSTPSPHLQTYSGKVRGERFRGYNIVRREASLGGNAHNESNLNMKNKEYFHSGDALLSRQYKNGAMYPDRRTVDENRVKVPLSWDLNTKKRVREEFTPLENLMTSEVDKLPRTNQVMRSGAGMAWSDDEEVSVETSCSVH